MEPLIFLALFVLGLYLVVRLAAKGLAGLAGSRFKAYRQLALRYGGKYENRGLVDPPTVSFSHNGSNVRVGLAPTVPGQPSYPRTRVVSRFAKGVPFRLELLPMGRPAPAQPPKGTRPVRSGHAEFDRGYMIQANDAEMARTLFDSATVRGSIENLRRLAPPAGILISINPERILVQVDRNLGHQAPLLDAAVREALVVHDALRQSVASQIDRGIDIVAVGAASPEEAGPTMCEVCGDPLLGARVLCVLCKTPFHRDCWAFIGGCSTFGCTSKQCAPG
jgi:Prokaryotic RING finger family 1